MEFTRTSSGLGNQYLFYNVDAIVYTEGGEISWSMENVIAGKFNESSIDIIFWRKLFNTFSPQKKIKFKALGSKTTTYKIAQEIIKNDLKFVIATMDSEFDEIYNLKLKHQNIIYTYGYSWENDVWNIELFQSIIEELSGEVFDKDQIKQCILNFFQKIEISVFADGLLFGKGKSFLPRKGHLKCIDCTLNNSPVVIEDFVSQLIEHNQLETEDVLKFGKEYNLTVERYCYGHLLNDFYYHACRYFSQVVLKINVINKELFERLAISKIIKFGKTEILAYYSEAINKLDSNMN